MDHPLDILLFGDQTGDYISIFRSLLQNNDDVYLKAFLDKIYLTLREEVSLQPLSSRDQIPGFSSISDLVARYAEPDVSKSNAVESALTCISQLACFFRYITRSLSKPITDYTMIVIRVRRLRLIPPQIAHVLLAPALVYWQLPLSHHLAILPTY